MQGENGFRFFTETPDLHVSGKIQSFIEQEINRPSKAWVNEVVGCKREIESVKLRTPEFVLLPDLNAHRRQQRVNKTHECTRYAPRIAGNNSRAFQRWPRQTYGEDLTARAHWQGICQAGQEQQARAHWPAISQAGQEQQSRGHWPGISQAGQGQQGRGHWPAISQSAHEQQARCLNWLAIVADPDIRSIRDLRADHVPMLERLYDQCLVAIQKEYKVEAHDVMVFANYPPSVYKLHFHFCAPFFTSSAYDAFRMHPLNAIINNLKICPEYYSVSSFQVPVHVGSELFRVTCAEDDFRLGAEEENQKTE